LRQGAQALEVEHRQRQPKLVRQAGNRAFEVVILVRWAAGRRFRLDGQFPGPFPPSKHVDAQVLRDPQNPGFEPLRLGQPREALKPLEQGFLGDVLGIVHVRQYAEAQAKMRR
jgi:hypothetical protein